MEIITNGTSITQIIPNEGKHLKNLKTGEVYAGSIYPAVSLTGSDFSEVTEQEYNLYLWSLDGENEPTADDYKQALIDLGVEI